MPGAQDHWPQVLDPWLVRAVGTAIPQGPPGLPPSSWHTPSCPDWKVPCRAWRRVPDSSLSLGVSLRLCARLLSWVLGTHPSPTSESPVFFLCFPRGQGPFLCGHQ